MKILITASTGQVGTALTEQGPAAGFDVVALPDRMLDITDAGAVRRAVDEHRPERMVPVRPGRDGRIDRRPQQPVPFQVVSHHPILARRSRSVWNGHGTDWSSR